MSVLEEAVKTHAQIISQRKYIPFKARENVQIRHHHMVALRAENYTVKKIGNIFGMDHSSVLYHVNRKCKCPLE